MSMSDRAAAAALPLALAGAGQRACLLDGVGAGLDGARHRLPGTLFELAADDDGLVADPRPALAADPRIR